jgi:hypothetical protein
MRLKWKLDSVCLEIVLILMQDRCTICDEHTTGSEIILDAYGFSFWILILVCLEIVLVSYGFSFWSVWR